MTEPKHDLHSSPMLPVGRVVELSGSATVVDVRSKNSVTDVPPVPDWARPRTLWTYCSVYAAA